MRKHLLERRRLDANHESAKGRIKVPWNDVTNKPIQGRVVDSDGALADVNEKVNLIISRLEGFGVLEGGGIT